MPHLLTALRQRLDRSPYPFSPGVFFLIYLAYAGLFFLGYPLFGDQTIVLALLPVALTAGLFGRDTGLMGGLAASLLNAVLLKAVGYAAPPLMYFSQSLFFSVLVILFGLLVGQISTGRRALRQELAERKAAQERLRQSELRYRAIVEDQADLICRYRADGTLTFVNEAFCRFFGKRPYECTGQTYHALVLGADAEWEMPTKPSGAAANGSGPAAVNPGAGQPAGTGQPAGASQDGEANSHADTLSEFRVTRADGTQAWLNWSTRPIYDEAGQLVEYQSVGRDVTQRKLNELKLRHINDQLQQAYAALDENRQRLYALFEYSLDAIVFADDHGRFIKVNPAACALSGYSEEAFYAMSFWTLTPVENVDASVEGWQQFIREGTCSGEFPIICKDGALRYTEFRAVANILPGLHVAIARDVTERKQAEARLEYLSAHDGLTGLFNRAYFDEAFDRLIDEAHLPLTVIMCDVDGLKRVNDTRGHLHGDELLRRAAVILRSCFRPEDVVARLGGDEFAVLLPHTPPEAAVRVLNRLRSHIEENNTLHADLPLGISCGAATLQAHQDPGMILHRADQAMYEEKARRRVERVMV